MYKILRHIFLFSFVLSFSAQARYVQVTNHTCNHFNVQCIGESKIKKLSPTKHIKCDSGTMHIWNGSKKPKKKICANLGKICDGKSTTSSLRTHFFIVVSGEGCPGSFIKHGQKGVLVGSAIGGSIQGS